jgi:hypothetical protein
MLVGLLLLSAVLYILRWIQLARLIPDVPGGLTPPVLGMFRSFKFLTNPPEFTAEQIRKYGRIFKINSIINFMVMVTEPDAVAQIFKVSLFYYWTI